MIKVLLVDDEKWARQIIKSFTRWDDLDLILVAEVENGEEALAAIHTYQPQIVITDMQMPLMDGVEFLQTVHQQYPNIKVVVISGHDDYAYMKQAIASKAIEYLLKPIDGDELNGVLETCIRQIYHDYQALAYADGVKEKTENIYSRYAKTLKYGLIEKDWGQIERTISQIVAELNGCEVQARLLVKDFHDEITLILREGWKALFKDVLFLEDYQIITTHVLQGIALETYEKELMTLLKAALHRFRVEIQSAERTVVELAKDHIDAHFETDLSLSQVADVFYTSKAYLSNAFKSKYGMTIGQYILKLKMEEAVCLLNKGYKHAKVSERLGYQDVSYFYKVFKKYYGTTPKDYCP